MMFHTMLLNLQRNKQKVATSDSKCHPVQELIVRPRCINVQPQSNVNDLETASSNQLKLRMHGSTRINRSKPNLPIPHCNILASIAHARTGRNLVCCRSKLVQK